MERLTFMHCDGTKLRFWSKEKKEVLAERLAAYEDIGLEPQQILQMKELLQNLCTGAEEILDNNQDYQ